MTKLGLSSFLIAALAPSAASAADAFSGEVASQLVEEGRWGLTVGGVAGFRPAYEGSDQYKFVGYPMIIPKYYTDDYDPRTARRVYGTGHRRCSHRSTTSRCVRPGTGCWL